MMSETAFSSIFFARALECAVSFFGKAINMTHGGYKIAHFAYLVPYGFFGDTMGCRCRPVALRQSKPESNLKSAPKKRKDVFICQKFSFGQKMAGFYFIYCCGK